MDESRPVGRNSPFSDDEASTLDRPADIARVARDFAVFTFRLHEPATNGFLTPAAFGKGIVLDTGRSRLEIAEEYTPLEVRKWAWNCSLAGIGVSAQAMDCALDEAFGQRPLQRRPVPRSDSLDDLDSARIVMYMIRCAFAHNPFNPRWESKGPYRDVFRVRSLGFELDMRALDGRFLAAGHIGGLDGYWNLLQFCLGRTSARVGGDA